MSIDVMHAFNSKECFQFFSPHSRVEFGPAKFESIYFG